MKKLMIAAMAVAMFATPAMAGGQSALTDAERQAIHDAKEAADASDECNDALAQYIKKGGNWQDVVIACGL